MSLPANILNHRVEQCRMCPKPCEHRLVESYLGEQNNACPKGRWMAYQIFVKSEGWKGAGDAVAAVAQPIAGVIDKMFKTNVKGCQACQKRKELLNKYLPFQF